MMNSTQVITPTSTKLKNLDPVIVNHSLPVGTRLGGAGIAFVVNDEHGRAVLMCKNVMGSLEFTGGRVSKSKDLTSAHTAGREASEELGLSRIFTEVFAQYIMRKPVGVLKFIGNRAYILYIIKLSSFNVETASAAAAVRRNLFNASGKECKRILRESAEMKGYKKIYMSNGTFANNDDNVYRDRSRYFLNDKIFQHQLAAVCADETYPAIDVDKLNIELRLTYT